MKLSRSSAIIGGVGHLRVQRVWQRACFGRIRPAGSNNSITGISAVGSAPALGVRSHSSMRIFSNPATPLHSKRTRLSPLNKIPAKVVHTTCLLLQNKISYLFPGVAQLVARVVWDHQAAGSNPVTRTKIASFHIENWRFLVFSSFY